MDSAVTPQSMAQSLAEIADAHGRELRVFARNKVGSGAAAEDLVQEAFLRLADACDVEIRNPRAFLYRIITNLAVDFRRREARDRVRVLPLGDAGLAAADQVDAETGLIARQRLERLKQVVDHLPPRCRECFVLRRFEDVAPDEIARRMGISRNMVEKHLRYATVQCAQALRRGDL
ncbi:RNA polymerase sigma factor [Terrihabitans sp. B22-R8]|uniref:RNA polymerase sigma factor n=1 Tax=Terrihabitans sp. B22-R8 TaxID=3425128 RepID=UPI00403C7462